jgi:hypothetical protein
MCKQAQKFVAPNRLFTGLSGASELKSNTLWKRFSLKNSLLSLPGGGPRVQGAYNFYTKREEINRPTP